MTIREGQIWVAPGGGSRWLVLSVGSDFCWVFRLGTIATPDYDGRYVFPAKSFYGYTLESDAVDVLNVD